VVFFKLRHLQRKIWDGFVAAARIGRMEWRRAGLTMRRLYEAPRQISNEVSHGIDIVLDIDCAACVACIQAGLAGIRGWLM
jgi:hypothetical protein